MPGPELVRLTAAARAAGHRWDAIAAACDNGPGMDIPSVIRQQYWISPAVGPGPLFSATQRAARKLIGRDAGCHPPLTWPCPAAGSRLPILPPRTARVAPPAVSLPCHRVAQARRRACPGPSGRICPEGPGDRFCGRLTTLAHLSADSGLPPAAGRRVAAPSSRALRTAGCMPVTVTSAREQVGQAVCLCIVTFEANVRYCRDEGRW